MINGYPVVSSTQEQRKPFLSAIRILPLYIESSLKISALWLYELRIVHSQYPHLHSRIHIYLHPHALAPESSLAPIVPPTLTHRYELRPRKQLKATAIAQDDLALLASDTKEPQTYAQAISCSDSPRWFQAMRAELSVLADQGVWEVVPTPLNHNIVGSKWVFKDQAGCSWKCESL